MSEEKIKELMSNEEFVKGLFESGSYEAAQAKFKAEGVDVGIDELKSAVALLKKKADGELTDEELREAAGGGIIAGLGALAGVALAFGAAYGGYKITNAVKRC